MEKVMTRKQNLAPRRLMAVAFAGLVALGVAAPALSAPAPQDGTRIKRPAAPDARRGNWMREYVQLRVAEQNLRAAGVQLTSKEMDDLLEPMVVGGSVAGASDNPFQVALLTKNIANNYNAQFCGGTLVKANVVVTAAHCSDFITAGQVQVLTGTRNLDGTGTRRNVSRIAIHPSWNPNNYDYDVAVWVLSSSATGAPVASLASADPAVGTNLLVTGWGALSEGGSFPTTLRKATVPLVSTTNCNDSNSYNGQITSRMICAGYDAGGIDSCQGDSGGPLARGTVLTGIVSWGNGCARRNFHGVYTRVSNSSVRNFIISQGG
jgi:secreted trypsin-like serine protease